MPDVQSTLQPQPAAGAPGVSGATPAPSGVVNPSVAKPQQVPTIPNPTTVSSEPSFARSPIASSSTPSSSLPKPTLAPNPLKEIDEPKEPELPAPKTASTPQAPVNKIPVVAPVKPAVAVPAPTSPTPPTPVLASAPVAKPVSTPAASPVSSIPPASVKPVTPQVSPAVSVSVKPPQQIPVQAVKPFTPPNASQATSQTSAAPSTPVSPGMSAVSAPNPPGMTSPVMQRPLTAMPIAPFRPSTGGIAPGSQKPFGAQAPSALPSTPGMPSPIPKAPVMPVAPSSPPSSAPSMPSSVRPVGVAAPGAVVPGKPGAPGAPAGGAKPPGGLTPNKPLEQEKPSVKVAQIKDVQKSPFRFLPFILGILALLLVGWFVVSRFLGLGGTENVSPPIDNETPGRGGSTGSGSGKTRTLTYWGLWEPSTVLQEVFDEYEAENPGLTIEYTQQSPKDYRERVQDAIRKGTGPDIFRYHATWVPMLSSQLATIPSSVMTPTEFGSTFYPVMAKDLTTGQGVVGIPLMYEGLGLYYNKAIFTAANMTPPKSWTDLEDIAKKLRVPEDKTKKIERAGAALGTATNVDNFSDIVGLLMLQNSADPAKVSETLASDAFRYYSNFAKLHKVWDDTLPNSTYAFATEKVAVMLAPSWRAFEVKAINPNIDFAIAPVPQLPDQSTGYTSVTYASYWVEGVSKSGENQEDAWKLLKHLSSKEVLQKLHDAQAGGTPRLFGEIYPRPDMANLIANDPYLGAFVADAPKAKSWPFASRTFDNGLNDKIVKYFEDAVTALYMGRGTAAEILTTAQTGVQQVLQQYGVAVGR